MKRKKLAEILQDIGFTEKESLVYLACLSLGESSITEISRASGVKRPTTYLVLEALYKKEHVGRFTVGKRERYRVSNPAFLSKEMERKRDALDAIMPDLLRAGKIHSSTPDVSVYIGREGVRDILNDTLTAKKEIVGWFRAETNEDELDALYVPNYVERRVANKILLRGVMPDVSFQVDFERISKKEHREIYQIPEDEYSFNEELLIYNDKVAVISFQDSIGFVIENGYIARVLRMVFEASFRYAQSRSD